MKEYLSKNAGEWKDLLSTDNEKELKRYKYKIREKIEKNKQSEAVEYVIKSRFDNGAKKKNIENWLKNLKSKYYDNDCLQKITVRGVLYGKSY